MQIQTNLFLSTSSCIHEHFNCLCPKFWSFSLLLSCCLTWKETRLPLLFNSLQWNLLGTDMFATHWVYAQPANTAQEPTTYPTLAWLPSIHPSLPSITCLLDCLLYKITRPHCWYRTENAAEWEGETRVHSPTLHRQGRISAESSRAARKTDSRNGTPAKAFLVCVCWKATVWTRLQFPSWIQKEEEWYWLLLRTMTQWHIVLSCLPQEVPKLRSWKPTNDKWRERKKESPSVTDICFLLSLNYP